MSTLKMKIDPYKGINIVSMDDKPLSPYSELNNYMKEPFLKWAYRLLDSTERELNDDFNLLVVSEEFESKFMKDMQKDFKECVSFDTESFQINYSVSERYDLINEIANKYDVVVNFDKYRLPFYTDIQNKVKNELLVETEVEDAELIITKNKQLFDHIVGKKQKIILLLSDKSSVKHIVDMQYVWEIDEERLTEIINSITDRFVRIPFIVEVAQKLESKRDLMTIEDKEKLSVVTSIDMFVIVEDIEDIEIGHEYEITFRTIPKNEKIPEIKIVSLNTNVVSVNEKALCANQIGNAVVEFYKSEEIIPFAKKSISTFRNNYVKEIELSVFEEKMGIGKEQKISILLTPEDADDVNEVKWSIDNLDIADISTDGVIKTKSEGRVTVTAQTERIRKTIDVEVLPNISHIELSEINVELYVGQSKELIIDIEPSNSYNLEYEWKTSDKSVASIEILDDGTEVIKANGIGDCIITCKAKEGNCTASCNIKVESTFKKRERVHNMLTVTALCMVTTFVCALMAFKIGTVLAVIATIISGVKTIKENKNDRFWAILLIVIAVLMLV